MSQTIDINGTEFITTRAAAQVANYSHDYISKLARDRKVKGVQLGRQWYVDPTSLENFLTSTQLEKEARRRQLQRERQLERQAREAVTASAAEDAKTDEVTGTAPVRHLDVKVVATAVYAFVILSAAALTGGVFYLMHEATVAVLSTPTQPTQVAQTSVAAPSAPAVLDSSAVTPAEPAALTTAPVVAPTLATTSTINRSGLLLLASTTSEAEVAELTDLFSDEVIVEYADTHRGTVAPVLRGGEAGEAVRFIEVPVRQTTTADDE